MSIIEITAAEKAAYKSMLAILKADRKAHSQEIREAKATVRDLQHNRSTSEKPWLSDIAQATLIQLRQKVRVEHLLYGALRGRTWQQMEPVRQESNKLQTYYLKARWIDEVSVYQQATGKILENEIVQEILSQ